MENYSFKRDLIINISEHETRLAVLEDGKLVELWVERPEKERMVGDIYKGVVTAVFPGMQAAFIDIGLDKNSFLHISDMSDLSNVDFLEEEPHIRKKKKFPQKIEQILRKGQEILVQVTKEPMGTKGSRVTSDLSLPGRYLVLAPGESHIGVSRKIKDLEEKRRLKKIVSGLRPDGFGIIIRTAAEGKDKKEFKSDIRTLLRLWKKIKRNGEKRKAPALLFKDIGMIFSLLRDILSPQIGEIVVDSKRTYKMILSYLRSIAPSYRSKVKWYDQGIPIFDFYNIENEMDKMLERKVWIKKGAYLVIDHTEAMVTIDVNTGRFVGKSDQSATILKANSEAAKEIARQIRLRDIGGLIIIDFIDMDSKENRKKVYEQFKEALKNDRSKSSILPISDFGLIEMTRERVRPSLMYTFSDPCHICHGVGRVLSKETQATKIERWFLRAKVRSPEKDYRLLVSPEIAKILAEGKKSRIEELEKELKLDILLVKKDDMPVDQFKVLDKNGLELTEKFKT